MLSISKIFFSLLFLSNVLVSAQFSMKPKTHKLKMEPLNLAELSEDMREQIKNELKQESEKPKKTEVFSESHVAEIEMVFEHSPKKAQNIVKQLEDPDNSHDNPRYIFFVGDTGTGKTTMSEAIAHKMSQKGWHFIRVSSCQLLGSYRHVTGMRLENTLEKAASSNQPTLIIIDDLDLFLQHTDSKYHDTAETSEILWDFLEREKNNQNLFFIGILPNSTKMSDTARYKIFKNCVKFEPINKLLDRKNIFVKHLSRDDLKLHPEITDDFLFTQLAKIGSCSGRTLEQLSILTYQAQANQTPDSANKVIKKDSIEKAVKEYLDLQEYMYPKKKRS